MANGLTGLAGSKKGATLVGTAATLLSLMAQGSLPVTLGAKLIAGLGALHIVSQAAVDFAKERRKYADPKTGL